MDPDPQGRPLEKCEKDAKAGRGKCEKSANEGGRVGNWGDWLAGMQAAESGK